MANNIPIASDFQDPVEKIDAICNDFEADWKRDEQPKIENYLPRVPEQLRVELLAELLRCEFQLMEKDGVEPEEAKYLARFPADAEVVREVFTNHGLDETLALSRPPGDSTKGPRAGRASFAQGELDGKQFGDYVLLEEIARGGMGVVYKAHHRSLDRTVALKMILAADLAGEEEVKRFLSEAEAAAKLDHPNIVPVYEVGRQDGQYFFSMGYVAGSSLSAAVSDGPLAPRDAAELVKTIAQAVAFAHGQGIVHRDLKPANVLLDENGTPRVADFGLAKRIDRDSGMTVTGQVIGTPSYMPPEQAAGRINEIGPRSDVYSLGALLYHLLTGRPPFQAATVAETLRQVEEKEPLSPQQLNPDVDRDLGTICLKCLGKQPPERYQSATELADELGRFLEGRPILARPISRPARFLRWSKRNPVLATVSAASLLLLLALSIGGPLVALEQARLSKIAKNESERADGEREKAIAERDNARAELKEHQQTLQAYVDTVGEAELLKDSRFLPLKRELLKDALSHYQRFLVRHRDDPEWEAEVALALRDVAFISERTLGVSKEDALAAYKEARVIYERLARENPANTKHQSNLSEIHFSVGFLYSETGQLAEALDAYQKSLEIRERLTRENPTALDYQSAIARCHNAIGVLYSDLGKPDQALGSYQNSLEIAERLARDDPSATEYQNALATYHKNIGMTFSREGKQGEALGAYQKALEIRQRLLRDNPTEPEYLINLANIQNVIGVMYSDTGRLADALTAHQKTLEIREMLARANPTISELQRDLVTSHHNVGRLYEDTGKFADASVAHLKALEISERLAHENPLVTDHQRKLAQCYLTLGRFYAKTGKVADALDAYQKAQELSEYLGRQNASIPVLQSDIAFSLNNMGILLWQTGKLTDALAAYQKALKIQDRLARQNPDDTELQSSLGNTHVNIGVLFSETGRSAEALDAYQNALEIWERLVHDSPSATGYRNNLAKLQLNFGNLHRRNDEPTEALVAYQKSLEIWERLARDNSSATEFQLHLASIHSNIGLLHSETGRLADSLVAYQNAHKIQERLAREYPTVTEHQAVLSAILSNAGMLFSKTGRPAEALDVYQKALEILKRLVLDNPTVTAYGSQLAKCYDNIGELHRDNGKSADALDAYLKAVEIWDRLARDDSSTNITQLQLATTHSNIGRVRSETGQEAGALDAYHEALNVLERLAGDNPTASEYRSNLAKGHIQIAMLHQRTGMLEEALLEIQKALEIWERLAHDNPTVTRYAIDFAQALVNFSLLNKTEKPESTLVALHRAISTLNDVCESEPQNVRAQDFLRDAHKVRAETYDELKRYREAAADWGEAIERDDGNSSSRLALNRVVSLARSGQHGDMMSEVDSLTTQIKPEEGLELAKVCAICILAASMDETLENSHRKKFADQYVDKALTLLKRAAEAGVFQEEGNLTLLYTHADFAPLRNREDLQELLKSLDQEN